jgi:hypothetical protein
MAKIATRRIVAVYRGGEHRQRQQAENDRHYNDACRHGEFGQADSRTRLARAAPVAYRSREADEEKTQQPGLLEQCPRDIGPSDALVEKDHIAGYRPRDARHEQDRCPVGPVPVRGQTGNQEGDQHEGAHRVGQVHCGLKGPTVQVQHRLEPDDSGNRSNGEPGNGAV